jgi:hypothetical protein
MLKMISKIFRYLEPMWLGTDGKISVRAVGFISLTIDFISNMRHAVYKWTELRSLEGLSLILGIEAGFATTLLGIAAWSNMSNRKLDNASISPTSQTASNIRIQNNDPDVPKVEIPET